LKFSGGHAGKLQAADACAAAGRPNPGAEALSPDSERDTGRFIDSQRL